MTNVQARLIASGLVLIAGAILMGTFHDAGGLGLSALGFVLFVVEYVRSQFPSRTPSGTPPT